MSFEWGIKDWREDIGEYYDQHFSEEEMEIITKSLEVMFVWKL